MIVVRAPRRRDTVGVTQLRANTLYQPAVEAAAQDVRHHFERWIVLIAKLAAEMSEREKRLRYVCFGGEKEGVHRLGVDGREWRHRRPFPGPIPPTPLPPGVSVGGCTIPYDR